MSNYKGLYIKLYHNEDKDVIECLDQQENKQAFIKSLIRKYQMKCKLNAEYGKGVCDESIREGDKH